MKGVAWGALCNEYKDNKFNAAKLEAETAKLIADDDVTNKKGIYPYLLTRDEKHLNIRAFTASQKQKAYEKQKGLCPKCPNTKHWELDEMQADHIKPWHEGGKTIDALLIFPGAIVVEFLRALVVRPLVESVTVAAKIEKRHAIAAGSGDTLYGHMNESACARIGREMLCEFGKLRGVGSDERPSAVKPDNLRRTLERAKHDDNTPILTEMSRRFSTATCVILIHDFHRPKNKECLATLGRSVDMTVWGKRSGGDKEHGLFRNPGREFSINVFALFAHGVIRDFQRSQPQT